MIPKPRDGKPVIHPVRKSTPTLEASSRFKGFAPETENTVREAKVEKSPELEAMLAAWIAIPYDNPHIPAAIKRDLLRYDQESDYYLRFSKAIRSLDYSSRNVEQFSIAISGFDGFDSEKKAGLALSCLVNYGNESGYVIQARQFGGYIHKIGYKNEKSLRIIGDVGIQCAAFMVSGSITVQGNAGAEAGTWMKGGRLTVEQDAWRDVGHFLDGGEIHVQGNLRGISRMIMSGKIFHKGELIWPEEVREG
jgi:hypothetical protein